MSAARLVKRAKKKAAKKAAKKTKRAQTRKTPAVAVVKTAAKIAAATSAVKTVVDAVIDAVETVRENRKNQNNNSGNGGARLVNRAKKKDAAKVRSYRHDHTRVNIPHAGTAGKAKNKPQPNNNNHHNNTANTAQNNHDPHLHPTLQWAGRQNAPAINVPSQPLHVHERVDPAVIIRATLKKNGNGQPPLFESPEDKLPLERELEFYQHQKNWSNRLIAGDSAIVMKSLVQKEGMGGKVQCVYMDPPYGIKYGSNFQPFVNKREVKDGSDKDLTTEPEMIRAFRDTWELGIHSYLSHLRDRLALCRELLNDSGSCFVQISDQNVHLVRCVMDEIFGENNFVSMITYKTTGGMTQKNAPRRISDYLIWYAKNKDEMKFNRLVVPSEIDTSYFRTVEDKNGKRRSMTPEERSNPEKIPATSRAYYTLPLHSKRESGGEVDGAPREFEGEMWAIPAGSWRFSHSGFQALIEAGRIIREKTSLRSIRYHDDFPYEELTSNWTDTGPEISKVYAVQTSLRPIQRCLLMTTDPGDLVLDPTCGSGTTAYVAEQWGRRWITCDTSRVALTLARQRLMTARFDYYKVQDESIGVRSGLVCKTVPHITLKSIANKQPPETETLHDQPEVDASKARVTGPFTVEAVPSPVVKGPDDFAVGDAPAVSEDSRVPPGSEEARMGGTARHAAWCAELRASGLRGKGGRKMEIEDIGPYSADTDFLHARFMARETGESGFVSFGPEYSPLGSDQVRRALKEMEYQRPSRSLLVFAAFEFDPEASLTIDRVEWRGVSVLKAKMSPDLQTGDLRRGRSGESSFWLMGRPDADLRRLDCGDDAGKWVAEVHGFDYYDPVSGEMRAGGADDIAMWMLDTDFDGASLYPRQVFFPLSAGAAMWRKLARDLRAEVDADLMERFTGRVSLPFEADAGKPRLAAVKIVDNRGIESLRVLRISG